MSKPMLHFAITANRLRDGKVLYRAAGPRWTERFDEAELFADPAGRDAALAWTRGEMADVCGPYALDVTVDAAGQRILSQRERLRAAGASEVLGRLRLTAPELAAKIARTA